MWHRDFEQGFTLLELVIYTAILGMVGVFGASILNQVSRMYIQNQSRIEVSQNLRSASQIIQEAVGQARGVNSASGSVLNLAMPAGVVDPDPTQFTRNAVTSAIEKNAARITTARVRVTELEFSIVSTMPLLVDSVNRWAWNGNGLGWIDFNPSEGNVRVTMGEGDFFGYARAANAASGASLGFFSLNCLTPGNCVHPYRVSSDANGNLSGFAWNDIFGWVSFSCANDHNPDLSGVQPFCAANGGFDYRVTVATTTGVFSGWAWMPAFGWISFNCNNSGIGNTCGTVSYHVAAQRGVGRPINAIQTRIRMQYNTANPLAMHEETYSFAVALSPAAAVRVDTCTIGGLACSGASGATVSGVQITGANFLSGAAVRLSRPGFAEIVGSGFTLQAGALAGGSFNLAGAARGTWDVWVHNPDGQIGVLPDGFTIN